jgi:hypothetical protein
MRGRSTKKEVKTRIKKKEEYCRRRKERQQRPILETLVCRSYFFCSFHLGQCQCVEAIVKIKFLNKKN